MKRSPLYILLLLMALACKPTVPSEYIQPSELEDLLYDYHVAEAMAKNDGAGEIDFKRMRQIVIESLNFLFIKFFLT